MHSSGPSSQEGQLDIIVNGLPFTLGKDEQKDGLYAVFKKLRITSRDRIVVLNGSVVADGFETIMLCPGDDVELLHFIGGG